MFVVSKLRAFFWESPSTGLLYFHLGGYHIRASPCLEKPEGSTSQEGRCTSSSSLKIQGFPKIGGIYPFEVPRIRIMVYWGLYWGPNIEGNCHTAPKTPFHVRINSWKPRADAFMQPEPRGVLCNRLVSKCGVQCRDISTIIQPTLPLGRGIACFCASEGGWAPWPGHDNSPPAPQSKLQT